MACVSHAHILGVTVSDDLKWNRHKAETLKKLNRRLYFICKLKHANMKCKELLLFYRTCVRPVNDYMPVLCSLFVSHKYHTICITQMCALYNGAGRFACSPWSNGQSTGRSHPHAPIPSSMELKKDSNNRAWSIPITFHLNVIANCTMCQGLHGCIEPAAISCVP